MRVSRSALHAAEAEVARLRAENAELRRELAEVKALLVAGNAQVAELTAQVGKLTDAIARSNDRLAELAAAASRAKGKGARAEPAPKPPSPPPDVAPDQRKAFEDRPQPPTLPEKQKATPKPRKPTGRAPLPDHLKADESTSRPCACGKCGSARLDVVDTFDEEKLTVVREHQRRRVVHRVTSRCRDCGTRTTGEAPPAPWERSKVTCEWLAWLVVQKFSLLVPLDRILRHLRLQGIHLSMGTVVRFIDRAASLLDAIDGEHWKQLRAGTMMQSDGTGLSVLVPGVPGTHKGYLEVYLRGPIVVIQYEPEKGAEALEAKLRGYTGVLLVDAEHRFNGVFGPNGATEAGCNAHGRRKFEDAESSQPVLAAEGGRFLSAIFAAEDEARAAGLTGDALRAWRQDRIAPLYAAMRDWMRAVQPTLFPDDKLAAAIRYYTNHWDALTRWVDNPELPPDNSRAEREFQNVAKARLSWLFAGSTEGAHRAATLLGVVATARNVGVDVEKYLTWVFERRGTWRDRYNLAAADLTPAAYKRAIEGRPAG